MKSKIEQNLSYCCIQHILKGATFTLKANGFCADQQIFLNLVRCSKQKILRFLSHFSQFHYSSKNYLQVFAGKSASSMQTMGDRGQSANNQSNCKEGF